MRDNFDRRFSMRIPQQAWISCFLLLLTIGIPAGAQWDVRPENCLGGSLSAPIRMEVYSDFECPACRTFYMETVRQVLKDFSASDKVCVIYHEYPLAMHRYAREAARYSLAAQKLGRKQWAAIVDALYSSAPQWSLDGRIEPAIMGAISAEDFAKVKRNLQEPAIEEAIIRAIGLANQRSVKSTPTIFVNAVSRKEQRVEGPIPFNALRAYFSEIVK
jgi:protein-disulfide isomerase